MPIRLPTIIEPSARHSEPPRRSAVPRVCLLVVQLLVEGDVVVFVYVVNGTDHDFLAVGPVDGVGKGGASLIPVEVAVPAQGGELLTSPNEGRSAGREDVCDLGGLYKWAVLFQVDGSLDHVLELPLSQQVLQVLGRSSPQVGIDVEADEDL